MHRNIWNLWNILPIRATGLTSSKGDVGMGVGDLARMLTKLLRISALYTDRFFLPESSPRR